MKKKSFFIVIIAAVTALDQLVKHYIAANYAIGERHSLIPGIMSLTHTENPGVSFSIFADNPQVMFVVNIIAAVVVVILIIYIIRVKITAWLGVGISFVAGGALGNLIDRIRLGKVIDMFATDFVNFAIFNVADTFLTIGVIMLAIYIFTSGKKA